MNTPREQLDAQLTDASTNREIAEAIAKLATNAWRTGDEEALRRLEFWFIAYGISSKKDEVSQQISLHPSAVTMLEQASWHLDRGWNQPITARRCAKALIHNETIRGDPVEDISRGGQGCACQWFDAHVGGYFYAGDNWKKPHVKPIHLGPWRIGVSWVMGVPSKDIFDLRGLYDEIRREALGGVTQLSLF